ncbi:MAG: hypothetical protein ACTHOR_07620 [Devosia sp.]|jgi:hypothetical protein|nr:hypothetical protein [Devosiaceae bacterium]
MPRSPRPPPATLQRVKLWWYALALVPIALLIYAPLQGWLPGEVILVALFLLFFWIFSLGFAIYARLSKPRRLRQ